MKPKVGLYHYERRGRGYRIYRYTYVDENTASAAVVVGEPEFSDPEQARRRVYELNGWTLTPQ